MELPGAHPTARSSVCNDILPNPGTSPEYRIPAVKIPYRQTPDYLHLVALGSIQLILLGPSPWYLTTDLEFALLHPGCPSIRPFPPSPPPADQGSTWAAAGLVLGSKIRSFLSCGETRRTVGGERHGEHRTVNAHWTECMVVGGDHQPQNSTSL